MYLIFDTETTGLPKKWNAPISDINNWPRCVQLAWQIHDILGNCVESKDFLIKPEGYNIPYDSQKIHGISTELAERDGYELFEVLTQFNEALKNSKFIIGHNVKFDLNIMGSEFYRAKLIIEIPEKKIEITESQLTEAFRRSQGAGHFLKELIKQLGLEND